MRVYDICLHYVYYIMNFYSFLMHLISALLIACGVSFLLIVVLRVNGVY